MSKVFHQDATFTGLTVLPQGAYEDCVFSGCQFPQADFTGYVFADCVFQDCDLSGVVLTETALKTVRFERCKLLGVHFEDCRDFLFAVTFQDCNLELATFIGWNLRGTSFQKCLLQEVDFTNANLQAADFSESNLQRAIFERTDLRQADFRTARQYTFSPAQNRLKGAKFSFTGLPGLLREHGIVVE